MSVTLNASRWWRIFNVFVGQCLRSCLVCWPAAAPLCLLSPTPLSLGPTLRAHLRCGSADRQLSRGQDRPGWVFLDSALPLVIFLIHWILWVKSNKKHVDKQLKGQCIYIYISGYLGIKPYCRLINGHGCCVLVLPSVLNLFDTNPLFFIWIVIQKYYHNHHIA